MMLTASPRARSVAWAQEIVSDPRTVFIDTETTGLDETAEIVDIAVVGVNGDVLLDTLVKPRWPIPPGVSRIHGIYDRDVAHAASWSEVYGLALPLLVDRPVVIFNADYDRKIILQCCAHMQLPLIFGAGNWQCAMKRHAEYVGEPGRYGRGYRWHKLENAARSFGIAPGGHRALGDAEACRQVVHAMARG
jgi:DNA polymerase III subunit epsilon